MTPRAEPAPGQPIASVDAGSLAAEAGLRPGDRVVAVNGVAPRDAIDFRFRTTEDFVALDVIHDGAPGVVEFEKSTDETLGIEFGGEAFGGTSLCNNKCFFCFLKGLPKGLRRPLYVKDDDYRLSFLHGNFVTLTNLEEDDWERLAEQRLSPLNVSVHSDRSGAAARIARQPARARRAGATAAAGLDRDRGADADRRLSRRERRCRAGRDDRGAAGPRQRADHRRGCRWATASTARRASITRACAGTRRRRRGASCGRVGRWQRRARAACGRSRVFASDEFYLSAGARIPSAAR